MLTKTDFFSILNRGLALVAGLLLVVLNIHYVGVAGQGEIALVNFGILLISTTSQFIGGGSLIYLAKKYNVNQFNQPALLWAVLSTLVVSVIGYYLNFPHLELIALIGFVQSILIYFQMICLAQTRIMAYQGLLLTQTVLTPIAVALFYWGFEPSTLAFCLGLISALSITTIAGIIQHVHSISKLKSTSVTKTNHLYKDLIEYGGFNQMANLAHIGNQRIYIYLLESMLHQGYLLSGIFAIYLYLAEAIWTVSKSLSSILTSLVAQTDDRNKQRGHFNKYLRLSIIGTFVLCLFALLVPKQIFEPYFKLAATDIQTNFILMLPAILVHGITVPISHYFSGLGLLKYNFYCAFFGLLSGLSAGLILIPTNQIQGAFVSISIGFFIQCSLHVYYLLTLRPNQD